jgi:hypothetical protein
MIEIKVGQVVMWRGEDNNKANRIFDRFVGFSGNKFNSMFNQDVFLANNGSIEKEFVTAKSDPLRLTT